MLSRLRQTYCQEARNILLFASVISSAGALLALTTMLQRLSALQSFVPSGDSVPLAQRFVKADDVQILLWDITSLKFQLLIALCLVVRALGQLSVWHGHTANRVGEPRRSIQGAYIRRDAEPAVNQAKRIRPETLSRIGHLAKYVLAV